MDWVTPLRAPRLLIFLLKQKATSKSPDCRTIISSKSYSSVLNIWFSEQKC